MFEFNETHMMIQDMFRQYFTKEIEPHIDELEEGRNPFPFFKAMAETLGVAAQVDGMDFSKPLLGGGKEKRPRDPNNPMEGMEVVAANIMIKEMARVSPALAMSFGVSTGLAGGTIIMKGTPEQKEKYGKPLLKIDKIGAWCLTEPGAGSDAFGSMRTKAVIDGDHYVLNGTKTFITNAPIAEIFLVYAMLEHPERGKEIQSFIITREDKGISTGQPFAKMGMKASPTGEVFLEDCRIPRDRILGGEKGIRERDFVKEGLSNERSGLPAISLGCIERCFEIAVKYAREREQFGQPIINFQLIQARLSRMYIAMLNARNLYYKSINEAISGNQTRLDVCAGKLYCGEMATWVANEAISIMGGYGYMREYTVERLARDAKLLEIGAGTNEMQIITMGEDLAKVWKP